MAAIINASPTLTNGGQYGHQKVQREDNAAPAANASAKKM